MTSLRMTWRSVELTLATALLILGLLVLFAAPITHAASCDASLYVTGDLVGDGNPAEVYAMLCSQILASATTPG